MKEPRHPLVAALVVAVSIVAFAAAAPPCIAAPASQPPAAQPSGDSGSLSGKVVETMDAGGYTYLAVMKGGEKQWAAIPATKITVGQEVKLQRGIEMADFPSRALGRTFKRILFCGGLAGPAGNAGAPGASAVTAGAGKPAPVPEYLTGKAAEVLNSGGYTYINLERNGKRSWFAVPSVKVRVGDVVQIMPGAVMRHFTSKTLNRAFPEITFSSQAVRK